MMIDVPKDYKNLKISFIQQAYRIFELEERLKLATHQRFGASNEKLTHPGMIPLFPEIEEEIEDKKEEKEIEIGSHKRKITKKSLPENLPREDVFCDLSEKEKSCSCCQGLMTKVSEKSSEKLHIKPAEFIVKNFITPVYSCKACEEVKQARMPYHPIPKAKVTLETLAHIAISKYIDGLPLYRLEKLFLRYNIDLKRDKLSRWMISIANKLAPIRDEMLQNLLQSGYLGIDETTFKVLKEKGRKAHQKSYMIVQAREGPPGKSIAVFHYETSRATAVVSRYLRGFKGCLVSDGLEVYSSFSKDKADIIHGGCWAHARRKFTEASKGKKGRPVVASEALKLIKELFLVERDIKNKSKDERKASRQKESKEIIEKIHLLVKEKINSIPRKSLTGKALSYLENQWQKLIMFLDHPDLPIHNNFTEQQIRPFVVGRKAWLFSDTVAGANASAILYSLLHTAKLNGLNPYHYLCETLRNLEHKEPSELLPFA